MKYVVYRRKKYTVNTDPLRRCYDGVHCSSEDRWTEWTDLLSYATPEEADASANDFQKINPDREYKVIEEAKT